MAQGEDWGPPGDRSETCSTMDFEGALTSVERGPGDQRQQAIVTLTPGAEEGADNIEGGTGNDWLPVCRFR